MEITINRFHGQTITAITGAEAESEEVIFTLSSGQRIKMHHQQDCCEYIRVESVSPGFMNLVGQTITAVEESQERQDGYDYGSSTRTIFKLNGEKIEWLGTSNGEYNEDVQLELIG